VKQLRELGARVERGVRDGRMSNIHYRDLADFLRKYEYDQVSTPMGRHHISIGYSSAV